MAFLAATGHAWQKEVREHWERGPTYFAWTEESMPEELVRWFALLLRQTKAYWRLEHAWQRKGLSRKIGNTRFSTSPRLFERWIFMLRQ